MPLKVLPGPVRWNVVLNVESNPPVVQQRTRHSCKLFPKELQTGLFPCRRGEHTVSIEKGRGVRGAGPFACPPSHGGAVEEISTVLVGLEINFSGPISRRIGQSPGRRTAFPMVGRGFPAGEQEKPCACSPFCNF
jgi:hypothetical protein